MSPHPAANHNGEWSRKRPGATYAWARRQPPPPPPPRRTPSHNTSSSNRYANASHTHANAATDGGKSLFRRRTEELHREREKIEAVSGPLRALQVFLALALISVFAVPSMGLTRYVVLIEYLPFAERCGRTNYTSSGQLNQQHSEGGLIDRKKDSDPSFHSVHNPSWTRLLSYIYYDWSSIRPFISYDVSAWSVEFPQLRRYLFNATVHAWNLKLSWPLSNLLSQCLLVGCREALKRSFLEWGRMHSVNLQMTGRKNSLNPMEGKDVRVFGITRWNLFQELPSTVLERRSQHLSEPN